MRDGLRYKLSIVAIVYVIEGFPMGLFSKVLPVFLRSHDVSLTWIGGGLSILGLSWSAKALWSPLVDRYGERRQWIRGALLVMAAALAVPVALDPGRMGLAIWLAFAAYCLASATQDIAIDAYTIGFIDRGQEGPANGVRFAAYRMGMMVAGGLLLLPRWIAWEGTFAVASALSVGMVASLWLCPRIEVPPEAQRDTWGALRRWADRSGAIPVAGFAMLYRVGDRAMAPMVEPFWVDRGFTNEEIFLFTSTLGIVLTVVGALVGGAIVARIGIGRSLWWLGIPALASNGAYAAAAAWPEVGSGGVYAASLVESLCGGLASAAFLSFLMRICQKEHAAVQYALLTALYAVVGHLVAIPSGYITERVGYAAYFALTAGYALPAFAFLRGARSWLEGRDA